MTVEDLRILGISMMGPILGSLAGVAFRPGERLLYAMLSFAGGTMLGISFLELLPESMLLCGTTGCMLGVTVGVLIMLLLGDMMDSAQGQGVSKRGRLETASLMMIAAIFLHNFPEGIAMAAGSCMSGNGKAMMIAIAIATHDIPEGICTSAPYYYATGKRGRAFWQSASTALPVIFGYFLGKSIFTRMNDYALGMMIGSVAGMMIYVSCKELMPSSHESGSPKLSMVALMVGILFVLVLGSLQIG